jgi:hypothetical protein
LQFPQKNCAIEVYSPCYNAICDNVITLIKILAGPQEADLLTTKYITPSEINQRISFYIISAHCRSVNQSNLQKDLMCFLAMAGAKDAGSEAWRSI